MTEYINREETIKALTFDYAYSAADLVKNEIPVADVQEVKHAKWQKRKNKKVGEAEANCSNCGREVVYQIINDRYQFENFCPHCGARMEKSEDE